MRTLLLSNPITSIEGFAILEDNKLSIEKLQANIYNPDEKNKTISKYNTVITGGIDFSVFNPKYELHIKSENASINYYF